MAIPAGSRKISRTSREKLGTLLTDDIMRKQLGENAREFAGTLSWQATADSFADVLARCLALTRCHWQPSTRSISPTKRAPRRPRPDASDSGLLPASDRLPGWAADPDPSQRTLIGA